MANSRHVVFERNYDFTWPNGAVTAHKAGWSGRVKAEVAEAALAAGAARAGKPEPEPEPEPEETLRDKSESE